MFSSFYQETKFINFQKEISKQRKYKHKLPPPFFSSQEGQLSPTWYRSMLWPADVFFLYTLDHRLTLKSNYSSIPEDSSNNVLPDGP